MSPGTVTGVTTVPPRALPGLLRNRPDPAGLRQAEGDGAEPEGLFCAAAFAGPGLAVLAGVWAESAPVDGRTVVLAQIGDPTELRARLGDAVHGAPVGLGLARTGWAGARASCIDALQAHDLAVRRGVDASFGADWVAATMLAARDRLAEIWTAGELVAGDSTHLADAVRAFAQNRLSVVAAARSLHVHPNTVIYRLERWQQLTGWDARGYPGLAMSMACLEASA
jgi:hypothetical protein